MLVQAIGSDDMVEGAEAFMEKRKPDVPRPRLTLGFPPGTNSDMSEKYAAELANLRTTTQTCPSCGGHASP